MYGLPSLPSGWRLIPFDEVLADGTRNGMYKPKSFHGRGCKIVNMGELFAHPRMGNVDMRRIEVTVSELSRFELKTGDLLFARRSLVAEGAGKCSIVIRVDEPTVFESSIIRARLSNEAHPLFFYYFFGSRFGAAALDSIRRQVAVAGITGADLRGLHVPYPPPSAQAEIAALLGALDDKIELNRRMNETFEALCRGLFTRTAQGATSSLLGDFVDINSRKRDARYPHRAIEYVEISGVSRGRLESTSRYPADQAPGRAQRLVQGGDTIWSCVRPNRRSYAFVDTPPENLIVSTGFATLTPTGLPPAYLYFATTSDEFVDYLAANADGSAYPAVKPEHFAAAEIPLAATDEIAAFEMIARPALARAAANERESRTLAALRDALLPKLISGELRIRDAERAVEQAT